ncbi:Uncharacterised protein [Mycobacterium tuberculosis]|nr:Uncharacterised protein [Mycobacterium tuberculosis]
MRIDSAVCGVYRPARSIAICSISGGRADRIESYPADGDRVITLWRNPYR